MAQADSSIKDFAKQLVKLSFDEEGQLSQDKVASILATLRESLPHQIRSILKHYLHYLKKENRKSQAVIEYTGILRNETIENITQVLSTKYSRRITAVTKENPELIGGIRISVADDVYDISIIGQLKCLSKSIH